MESPLNRVLDQEDTVLFVGAGISSWSGLPRWPAAIIELAEFLEERGRDACLVRAEAARNDLLQAASYGFDQLTVSEVHEFVRKMCRVGRSRPHEIHKILVTLGPRSFITTNYDKLLEQSLGAWRPDVDIRVVTNRQLIETAEIVQARASGFVFKPHGDADDVESIVFTREQYRALLQDGELHHALESLKILLVSRPIVYVGFGLRDPDFLLIRDLLYNTYKGGARDHYAVMPDVSAPEIDYWRRHYGVHLFSYATRRLPDGSQDHSELLKLLRELGPNSSAQPSSGEPGEVALAETLKLILPLTRHAARLMPSERPALEFPLRINRENESRADEWDKYDGARVEEFLDNGPSRAIVVGAPGSGKSYALVHSASRLASLLQRGCLGEPFSPGGLVVPILVDLKLYSGDVVSLIDQTLPRGLSFLRLLKYFKVKVFLDAFNEMPRELLETGLWKIDLLHFLDEFASSSVVIASRTSDAVSDLGLPTYRLDEIDQAFVRDQMRRLALTVDRRFEEDIESLLSKPFYFRLVNDSNIPLAGRLRPQDVYSSLIQTLISDFKARFGLDFGLEKVLAQAAFAAIDRGEEAFPLSVMIDIIDGLRPKLRTQAPDSFAIVNWLVAKDFLLPFSSGRVAFFHQSVTEFLAATVFAEKYKSSRGMLKEKLGWRRWDNALFLTLGMLDEESAKKFLDDVVEIDFPLALSAVRFMECGAEVVVNRLLEEIPGRMVDTELAESDVCHALESIPVLKQHAEPLRRIVELGDSVGAAAASRWLHVTGASDWVGVLTMLLEHRNDYNFCSQLGRNEAHSLPAVELGYVLSVVDKAQSYLVEGEELPDGYGFTSGLAELLHSIPTRELYRVTFDKTVPFGKQTVRLCLLQDVLIDVSGGRRTSEALAIASDMARAGVKDALFAIHLLTSGQSKGLDWSVFDRTHVQMCIDLVRRGETGAWAAACLQTICTSRSDLALLALEAAMSTSGIRRACLLWASEPPTPDAVFRALGELLNMGPTDLAREPLEILAEMRIDWSGKEELFVSLLRLRNVSLAYHLLESCQIVGEPTIGNVDIGPINFWLDWLREDDGSEYRWFLEDRLAHLFDIRLAPQAKRQFLAEFNKRDSPYRKVLAGRVLGVRNDLTTADFSEEAISFLITELADQRGDIFLPGGLLGKTATEKFVNDVLLPQRKCASEPLKSKLDAVLHEAGKRHGRRYIPA